ncbi:hypothetical protein ACF0H5_023895 [Mactra antiquata]
MSESKISNTKGNQLFARYWNEDGQEIKDVKALIFIVHGYCEHCLAYNELAESLVNQGYYVFSHDHIGHGQSDGDRAHVCSFDEYVDDLFCHLDLITQKFPDKKVFLVGHSMGGAISVLAGLKRPSFFAGIVLIGPLLIADRKTATPFKIAVGKMAAKVLPHMHIAQVDPGKISRDKESVKNYTEDPLVYHGGVKCRWGVAMVEALQKIESSMPAIEWPFFVLHGSNDALCEVAGAKEIYEKAKSKDKQIKIFEEAFHQLHKEVEPVKTETFDLISDWLNNRA